MSTARWRHVVSALGGALVLHTMAPAAARAGQAGVLHGEDFSMVIERQKAIGGVARAVEVRDLVTIIEVSGDYERTLPDGTSNVTARQEVAQQFYQMQPDEYDFLVAFSTFEFDAGPARAFAWGVQNTDQGIGLPLFDSSDLFGSSGRLQSFVDMASLAGHETDPLAAGFEETLTILTHEIMHRWGARVRFELSDGTLSDDLLGSDGSHWSFLLDSRASVMYGNSWREEGDGTFTSVGTLKFYSPLDLYLAGLYAPEEVLPFFLIEASGEDPARLPELGAVVSGSRREITIEDVIAAEGPRIPAAGESPREFRAAFLLLTRPGETVGEAMIGAISFVRRELQTRFAALTGGRAVLQVYPPAVVEGEPGRPGGITGGDLRPQAALDDGLAWLRNRQTAEGFWEDTPATRVRDTALAVSVLAALDPIFGGAGPALDWLAAQPGPSTDSLARVALALDALGADATPLASALLGRANADGGWGVAAGYASDPLDTALAVTALAADRAPATALAVDQGVDYLLAAQNADGGFGNHTGGASRTLVTAAALRALEAADRRVDLPPSTLIWLAGRQNVDGGLGDSPSTAHDTANVLEALSSFGALTSIAAGEASAYLTSHQTINGSWEGSVYSTSLALLAIKRFNHPNLAFAAPPSVAPASPRDGERVTLTFSVINDGRLLITNGFLRLFEGDPDAGGLQVGGDLAVPPLTSGQIATITVSWDTFDKAGSNLLVAVLDPDEAVIELSELDNRTSVEVEVQQAPVEGDLSVAGSDVTFTPPQPAELPISLGIAATVRNLGQTEAADVVVRLYRGEPDGGMVVGETMILVPQRSSAAATFTYLLETAGSTLFTVVADPDDLVPEADETNNQAGATVTTSGTVDLSVAPSEVALAGPPLLGNDLTFEITFRNRGTLDSPDAVVRYRVTDGTETRDLGESTVQIAGGGAAERQVTWRVDLIGELELVVDIDPENLLPEVDEGNNTARVPFSTSEVSEADLIVDRGALSFDPNPGREGSPLTLTATLRNVGGATVIDAEVGFYEGDPRQGGSLIGVATVSSVGPGEAMQATYVWPRVPSSADRLIFAVADPGNLVAEFDEENNSTFELLEVLSLPDPAVAPASLALDPRFPQPGQTVTLTVRVSNLGEQEASNLLVRAFDGDTPVGGDQTIALLPGLGEATATFSWNIGPASGAARLISAFADPDGGLEEGSEANNQAAIAATVQDGDFFVTFRYFSPNGDGVQDDTQLFFRLPAPASVAVEVVDSVRNKVARRADLGTVAGGDFLWDGRDDRGGLVRDADYELRLVDAAGSTLNQATVTLDTDRLSLLQAAGTAYEAFTNLTCELRSVSAPLFTADEQWLFFSISDISDPVYPRGVYRMRPDGSDLQQVVQSSFIDVGWSLSSLLISPDGSRFAFYRIRSFPFRRELWVANGDGSGLLEIVNPENPAVSERSIGFSGAADALIVDRSSFRIFRRSLDGLTPDKMLLEANFLDEKMSADGRFLVFRGGTDCCDRMQLLDLESGVLVDLPVPYQRGNGVSFSPSGDRLALGDAAGDRLLIVGTGGEVLRSFDLPTDSRPPEVGEGDSGDPPDDDEDLPADKDSPLNDPTAIGAASWARSGTELALTAVYGDACRGGRYSRVLRFDLDNGAVESIGFTGLDENCSSYHISIWDGSTWVDRGEVHLGLRYREAKLELSDHLPDADGEYKVRIHQSGHEAAHVESVGLSAYGALYLPSEAFVVGGADALAVVTTFDGDVLDLHEKTMEVHWSEVPPEGGATLVLVAREETLSDRDASPFRYPALESASYSLLAGEGRAMVVDGDQTAADGLSAPIFRQRSHPDTGHPNAEVAGYAASDGESLYAALDFTVDNTLDGTADWAALYVQTEGVWREFRVTTAETTWGRAGFVRTGLVHHRHKYYEFRVPLAEIGAEPGDVLELRFAAYGTAATLPDSGLLPAGGGVLWDPNDRALLYTSVGFGEPSYAIFLDEDNRRLPVFGDWNSFDREQFSPTGRLLFFESADARNDPQSLCYLRGSTDHWTFRSLLNLTADLRPRRSSTLSGILVEGTATDRHFDRYELDYSASSPPQVWRPIQPPSGQPVVDGRFTTWVPPAPGSYFVRLSSFDRAGNQRRQIKRVVSSESPSITDLSVSPRLFSPNGDGILDRATIHYRVLQPVHLDFRFFNADGVRVRTIGRDHAVIGAELDLLWDGRDDHGLPLPDGAYRMTVQSYEFFLSIDSTAPVVRYLLKDAKQCVGTPPTLVVAPQLGFAVFERNFDTLAVDTGEGATPVAWLAKPQPFGPPRDGPSDFTDPDLGRPDIVGGGRLTLAELVDHSFRVEAFDLAGNRALVTTGLAAEELFITRFGRLELDPATGLLEPLSQIPCAGAFFRFELGDVRFEVAESVIPDLLELHVQVQTVPILNGTPRPDLLDPAGWFDTRITLFDRPGSPIPPELASFDWDMASVAPGVLTAIRLRALDSFGRQHLSDQLTVQTDGISFNGVLRDGEELAPHLRELVDALVAAIPAEQRDRLELWGQEFVREELGEVTLYLSSDEDPRYAVPRAIPAAAVLPGGFIFTAEDWQACLSYRGFVVGTTVAAIDPVSGQLGTRTLTTDVQGFRFPCLDLSARLDGIQVGACGQPAPTSVRTLTAHPRSFDGRPLQLLTVEGPDENGDLEVLFSVNNPTSAEAYAFEIETADIPEGTYPLTVRLTNVDGQEVAARGSVDPLGFKAPLLLVDRTPLSRLEITYPADGQRVCGVQRGSDSVIEIEGAFEDDLGGAYLLEAGEGQNPSEWQEAGGTQRILPSGTRELVLSHVGASSGGPVPESFFLLTPASNGVLGELANTSGDLSLRLRATNNSGAQSCSDPIVFTFDGRYDGAAASLDASLISPNGDGFLDAVTVTMATDEPGVVDARVSPGIVTGQCSTTGPPVRSLFDGLPLFDVGQAVWDGRDDGGVVVPDGWYQVRLDYEDGCGNPAEMPVCLEIDNSPPDLEILFPQPSDPLTQIVEVVGSVHDPHLESWTLDFGIGGNPDTWARIDGGDHSQLEEVLGVWNTYGLEGEYTLRLSGVDAAGNAGELRVPILRSNPLALLQYLEALPRPFSPNGDARREQLSIRFGLDGAALLDVTVVDLADVPVRTLGSDTLFQPGAAVVTWDGRDNAGLAAPDGIYRVVVIARLASNPLVSQEERVSAVLDATPPTLLFGRPAAGSFVPAEGAIEGTVLDPNLVEYVAYLTETPLAPVWSELSRGVTERSEYPLGTLADLEEGDYGLRLEAIDAGETTAELVIGFVVDDTPPVVSLSAPLSGAFLNGDELVTVAGAVEEENLAGWILEVGVGSEPTAWAELATGSELPVPEPLVGWDLGAVADGLYTLRLTATDLASLSASAQVAVTVDATPPAVAITAPSPGGYVSEPSAVLGTASDLNLVTYRLALASGPPSASQPFTEIGGGTTSVVSSALFGWLSLPPDGVYTLRLTATDAAGNQSSVANLATVDTVPPTPPQGLVATVQDGDDVQLTWQPNAEPDLDGYHVYRGGQQLTTELVPAPVYLDLELADGDYDYTVTAVDPAGLESGASAPATARIDGTPPNVAIQIPVVEARVSGLVDVVGTAYSTDDFKEYRLFAEPAGGGGAELLRRSPVATLSDALAQWNTTTLPEGAAYTLRLEGEDLSGNVATATVAVTIDNEPPAAPTGLVAVVTGDGVDLAWDPNSEPDLAGYLLYRGGRLANASGAVIGSLDPYLLGTEGYDDLDRPDGTYLYEVYAVDRAGNVSGPSAPAEATVETRPPAALIVQPEDGTEFEADLYLLAVSEDGDLERIQFQLRAAGTAAWADLGAAIEEQPWETDWDPSDGSFVYDDYELRAVATDFGGLTDPVPASITVTYTDLTRPAPVLGLAAQVDGGEVILAWSANTTDPDLEGYQVDRDSESGSKVRLTAEPIQDTAFVDGGLADDRYTYTVVAVDQVGNESEPSNEAEARVYTPELLQPYTPTQAATADFFGAGAVAVATVEAELETGGGTSPLAPAVSDAAGGFAFFGVPLVSGENKLIITVVDGAGNRSKQASARVIAGAAPSTPSGLAAALAGGFDVALTWNPNPEPDLFAYRLLRDGEPLPPVEAMTELVATASSVAGLFAAPERVLDGDPSTCWRPQFGVLPVGEWIELSWSGPRLVRRIEVDWHFFVSGNGTIVADNPGNWGLEAWDGGVWVPLFSARDDVSPGAAVTLSPSYLTSRLRLILGDVTKFPCLVEMLVAHLPLAATTAFTDSASDGSYEYEVLAVNALGFESAPSVPVVLDVGDVEPPEPVVLSAVVVGSDVQLSWATSSSPDVAVYDVLRGGDRIARHTDLAALAHVDAGLANGTYTYVVMAVDGVGNASLPSNGAEVTVAVAPPLAPVALTVTAPPVGGALDLAWNPGTGAAPAGFRVERATVAGGPYAAVATTPDASLRDSGLTDGVTYYYVAFALDSLGNASAPSNEASGIPSDDQPPAAPLLYYPGYPGKPVTVGQVEVMVAGDAEPGAEVSLRLDGREIAVVPALAEEERVPAIGLFTFGAHRLSPDGRWLWSEESGSHQLWDFEGSIGTSLQALVGADNVRWLPDSGGVVLTTGVGVPFGSDVLRYRLDGTIDTLLSIAEVVVAVPAPDGRHYAVVGLRSQVSGLWLVDSATGEWALLVEESHFDLRADSLAFSPDGRYLSFQRSQFGSPPLEIVDLTDGTVQEVAVAAWVGIAPSWSAGSDHLLFATRFGDVQLWTWRADLGLAEPVTAEIPFLVAALLLPAGDAVLYGVGQDGIYRQALSGGSPEQLQQTPGSSDIRLASAPIGHLVYLVSGNPMRVTPAGHFAVEALPLAPGDNTFTAVSADGSGNESPESAPMVVTLEVAVRPDLEIVPDGLVVFPAVPLVGSSARITATVRNTGATPAPAADLSLVLLSPTGGVQVLVDGPQLPALPPGSTAAVTVDHLFAGEPGIYRLIAAADPLDRIQELSELNNSSERTFGVAVDGEPFLTVKSDQAGYLADQEVVATVTLFSFGDALTGSIELTIEDASGFEVTRLADEPVVDLAYGASLTASRTWNTGTTFTGDYRVAALLRDAGGNLIAEAFAPFEILEAATLAASVVTDRATYLPGDTVRLAGTVTYLDGNASISGAAARLRLFDAGSVLVAEWSRSLGDLLPSASATVATDWLSAGAPAGSYSVTFEVLRGGGVAASASASFLLTPAGIAVDGDLTLTDGVPAVGFPLQATYSVINRGQVLPAVPITVAVRHPATGVVLASSLATVELPVGGTASGTVLFDTEPLGLGTFLAVLEAGLPDGTGGTAVATLDTSSFSTVDATPPVVTLLAPEEGSLVGAEPLAVASASDALSLIERVELSVDGGPWQVAPLADGPSGRYERRLAGLAEGEHALQARATDTAGNAATSAVAGFTVLFVPRLVAAKNDHLLVDADGDGWPSAGDTLGYTITVASTGDSGVSAARLDDVLPPEMTVVPGSVLSDTGAVLSEEPIAVDLGSLSPGDLATVTFEVTLAAALPADVFEVENQGVVSSVELPALLTDDPEGLGLADPTVTVLTPRPRLLASKLDELLVDAAGDGDPSAGDTLRYTISVVNRGSVAASEVVLEDAIPAATSVVAGSVLTDRGAVASEDPISVAIGTLEPGEWATIGFDVLVASPLPPGLAEVVNQGTVESAELPTVLTDDPDVGGEADPTVTALAGSPVLAVEKTGLLFGDLGGDGDVSPGDALLYRIVVTNSGNGPVTGLVLSDAIPAATAIEPGSVQASQGTVMSEQPVQVELGMLSAAATSVVTFRVTIADPFPVELLAVANQATVTSVELPSVPSDDPTTPEPQDATVTPIEISPLVTIGEATVAEGDGGAVPAILEVVLDRPSNRPLTASWATRDGSAMAGDDYTAAAGTLTIPAGETIAALAIDVLGDLLDEPDETVHVDLSDPVGGALGDPEGAVTIVDDDEAPVANIAGAIVTEGDSGSTPALFAVTLSSPSGFDVLVTWTTADGTGSAPADYVSASGAVLLPAGATSGAISVDVLGDLIDELDESFSLELVGADFAQLGATLASGTILDDDEAAFTVGDVDIEEGDSGATPLVFAVELDSPSDRETRVDWATVAGTAEERVDFTPADGTVVLPAGEVGAEVAIEVLGDLLLENDESFTLELSQPVAAAISDGSGVATILDDELCLGGELLQNPGAEEQLVDDDIPYWVEVAGTEWQRWLAPPDPVEGEASFYAAIPGSEGFVELAQEVALSPYAARIATGEQRFRFAGSVRTFDESPPDVARIVVEYLDASGTVALDTWDSGEIASPFGWTAVADERAVPPATATVRVRLMATLFSGDTVDGFFDGLSLRAVRSPEVTVDDSTVTEGDVNAIFTISLSCTWQEEVSVEWATADGTAVAGEDYFAASGSAVIAGGETSASVAVAVLADQVTEGDETFSLELTSAAPARVVLLNPRGTGLIVEEGFCPRSPGYWKNHPEVWPTSELQLGAVTYDAAGMMAILQYGGPDAATKLARQLLSTELNLLAGSPPEVQTTVDVAQAFLVAYPPGSNPKGDAKQTANALKDELEDYNTEECDD